MDVPELDVGAATPQPTSNSVNQEGKGKMWG
jgi:hypothetical protein